MKTERDAIHRVISKEASLLSSILKVINKEHFFDLIENSDFIKIREVINKESTDSDIILANEIIPILERAVKTSRILKELFDKQNADIILFVSAYVKLLRLNLAVRKNRFSKKDIYIDLPATLAKNTIFETNPFAPKTHLDTLYDFENIIYLNRGELIYDYMINEEFMKMLISCLDTLNGFSKLHIKQPISILLTFGFKGSLIKGELRDLKHMAKVVKESSVDFQGVMNKLKLDIVDIKCSNGNKIK